MSQNRLEKIALCTTAGIVLLLALVGLFIAVEQRRTQVETGAVLSALFSQGVLRDMDQWVQDAQSRFSFSAIQIVACVLEGSTDYLGFHGH
jgi:hypothetical protein